MYNYFKMSYLNYREKLYLDFVEPIANCKNCAAHETIEQFLNCMRIVRENMTMYVNTVMKSNITNHFECEICNHCK